MYVCMYVCRAGDGRTDDDDGDYETRRDGRTTYVVPKFQVGHWDQNPYGPSVSTTG